jgi:hypothetical protein
VFEVLAQGRKLDPRGFKFRPGADHVDFGGKTGTELRTHYFRTRSRRSALGFEDARGKKDGHQPFPCGSARMQMGIMSKALSSQQVESV